MNKWIENIGVEPETNGRNIDIRLDDGQVSYNNKYDWAWRLDVVHPITEWRFSEEESEFKQGEMIEVGDAPDRTDLVREFIGMLPNSSQTGFVFACKSLGVGGGIRTWDFAQAITKPKLVPYTFETFPRGVVYIKRKTQPQDRPSVSMVINIDWQEVDTNGECVSYSELDEYLISTDLCENWDECGAADL